MRASNWLNRLFKCESGNVLFIGAATLPMIMGAAGLAVDTVQLAMWKRQMQRAADSAALAGAHAKAQDGATGQAVANDLDEHIQFDVENNETPVLSGPPQIVEGSFAAGTLSAQSCAVRMIGPCFGQAVQVTLQSERRLTFMSMFTNTTNMIEARATAAVMNNGEFCMISTYNGNGSGIISGGNSRLDLSCGLMTNARSATDAVKIFGAAEVISPLIAAVGGIAPGNNTYSGQELQPYGSAIEDPLKDRELPVPPSDQACDQDFVYTPGIEVPAGSCFVNWDVKHGETVELAAGTHYVNNGLLDIKGSITGDNVTIVLLGDDSTLVQNGGGTLDITAPTSGDYEGIALYRERTASATANKEIKFNGGAELQITGIVYMPSTDFWIGGNTDFTSTCLKVIGRILEFKGGGSITNSCAGTGVDPITQPLVRLVG